jgi:hypothetical protein
VGKSTGYVTSPEDLLEDGYAIALHAYQELALDPHKVHFYGVSMGGAVAVNVVARLEKEGYKPATVCIDRSYSQLIQNIHHALPIGILKWLMSKLLHYTAWQIDSVQSALKLVYAKLVVIRSEADSVIPVKTSLATALEDHVEGKAWFKLIDLPKKEKTELDEMSHPDFPYWFKYEKQKTLLGRCHLFYIECSSYIEKIIIGIKAHSLPFSLEYYPLQAQAYQKELKAAENNLKPVTGAIIAS